jgi:hypothetical protein
MAKKFDYKKTLEKGLWGLGYALVTGFVVIATEDARFVALVPLLMMAQNYLKHKN